MQPMQSNYQDNMSDILTSFNLMNQLQHSFQQDQSSLVEYMLPTTTMYEPIMIYPDLPMVLDTSMSTKLQINDDSAMQNSYHISPSFTVVPPIHQTLENASFSLDDIYLAEQQEMELQKNLVKDVFFSPAMIDNNQTSQNNPPLLLSSCSSQSGSDDCHSLMSDTTVSSCSPSYQYDNDMQKEEEESCGRVFSSDSQDVDQVLFFYGLDLAQSAATTTEEEDTNKNGLGTSTSTSTTTTTSTGNNRRIKQKMMLTTATNSISDRSLLTAKKKKYQKTCNNDISKLLNNNKKPRQQTRKNSTSCNENTSNSSSSDAIVVKSSQYNSQKNNVISAWGYKRSDNKNDISNNSKAAITTESITGETSMSLIPNNKPRFICSPSIYQKLSKQNIDWCRYCGTTEGVNWRPGPWGKRTLCNKHGCDYKGYGFACKLPRLDLTSFTSETIDKRSRPVLQLFCSCCQRQESWKENVLVLCDGCPKAFHQTCYHQGPTLTNEFIKSDTPWYCSEECQDNLKRKRVVVELPRKRLPLMRTPKNATVTAETTTNTRLPRSSLREI